MGNIKIIGGFFRAKQKKQFIKSQWSLTINLGWLVGKIPAICIMLGNGEKGRILWKKCYHFCWIVY